MKLKRIGIKYCGGCNPRYDRRKLAERIQEEFGVRIRPLDSDLMYDLIIVLNGCTTKCANLKNLKSRKWIILDNENQCLEGFREFLHDF